MNFDLPNEDNYPSTPAEPGSVLMKGDKMTMTEQHKYRSGVGLPNEDNYPSTPAEPGSVLMKGEKMTMTEQHKYRSGVGKLLFLMKW
jgi:hypothetical protein